MFIIKVNQGQIQIQIMFNKEIIIYFKEKGKKNNNFKNQF
jgi:hypothetical protein